MLQWKYKACRRISSLVQTLLFTIMLTTFTVTETYTVTANTDAEVYSAVVDQDFSNVQVNLDKRKIHIEPNY
jgi:hypothetical protein